MPTTGVTASIVLVPFTGVVVVSGEPTGGADGLRPCAWTLLTPVRHRIALGLLRRELKRLERLVVEV